MSINGKTGVIVWTQALATGDEPYGFVEPTPVIDNNIVFLSNPLDQTVMAPDVRNVMWRSPVATNPDKPRQTRRIHKHTLSLSHEHIRYLHVLQS